MKDYVELLIKGALVFAEFSLIWHLLRRYQTSQFERKFALEKGCEPLRPWSAKWPMGLDLLVKVFQYAREERVLRFFVDVVGDSGNTFEQRLLGVTGIDTIDPENIEAILSTDFANYTLGLRPAHFKPLLGSGIFTQDGDAWKHSRQLLRPQFASNRRQNFEQIQRCVQGIINNIPENGVVDLQPLCFKLTFSTTMFLLFGDAVEAMNWGKVVGQKSRFSAAFNLGQDYLASRGRLGDLYWLINDRKFREACRVCHEFVDGAVADALEDSDDKRVEKEESYVFIQALLQQTRDPKRSRLLARHPHVLSRLREEVAEHAGIGPEAKLPTRDQLKKMTYLGLVIKEVLRLYPSVPVNSRSAIKTTTLPVGGGPDGRAPVLVPAGTAVGYCVYVMHRRKDLYGEDADEFRPERWEGDNLKDIGWGYLPFNGGPRVCLGQEFALLEVSYTLARFVQLFPGMKVSDNEPDVRIGEERQTLTLVVGCAEGCNVSLRGD
ncbi:n-alkane-inducible cytochrome P450 [Emericellopsis atlantica]|uniref:N-alkane-inducible cytochrome P450 n=1 Tax=Emericellopsis atlantica TaxID=2614577 RepID=A0A9P8CN60_9HYPO|nr:n-alkane-inducible cytochrome P450 [Emericellopsis atlantica]KAG9251386.1 n-alkane-inducible cytochrome P450 [Emericellopsis atlantica]